MTLNCEGAFNLVREVAFLGIGIAGGLAGGWLTALHFERRQRKAAEPSEELICDRIEKTYHQTLRLGISQSNVVAAIRRYELRHEEIDDIVEIKARMEQLLCRMNSTTGDLPQDEVIEYKSLGDRWSQIASERLGIQIVSADGRIELERLFAAHENLFPSDYLGAGVLRQRHAYILDTMGTVARIVDLSETASMMATIPPTAIRENLERLFEHWNSSLFQLELRPAAEKVREVSHFHHEFELIHPFSDGNGRIGRMVLVEHLAYLFGTKISFRPQRDAYYRAMRSMDLGSTDALCSLIEDELSKFLPEHWQR